MLKREVGQLEIDVEDAALPDARAVPVGQAQAHVSADIQREKGLAIPLRAAHVGHEHRRAQLVHPQLHQRVEARALLRLLCLNVGTRSVDLLTSDTFTVRFFFRFGNMSWIMSLKFSIPSAAPCGTIMSNMGPGDCVTSTSTSRPSSWPSMRRRRGPFRTTKFRPATPSRAVTGLNGKTSWRRTPRQTSASSSAVASTPYVRRMRTVHAGRPPAKRTGPPHPHHRSRPPGAGRRDPHQDLLRARQPGFGEPVPQRGLRTRQADRRLLAPGRRIGGSALADRPPLTLDRRCPCCRGAPPGR